MQFYIRIINRKGIGVKRTRYAHQVSLVSLSVPKRNTYSQYSSNAKGPPESLEMWSKRQSSDVHMFKYWSLVIELEQLMIGKVYFRQDVVNIYIHKIQ